MAGMRKLSPEEVKALGLGESKPVPGPAAEGATAPRLGRKLSPEEVTALGLPTKAPPVDEDAELLALADAGKPDVPPEESFGRGALGGASLNFDDELGAGLQALLSAGAQPPGKGFGETLDEAGKVYRQARYENRDEQKKAEAANPELYTAGQMVGTVASPANYMMPGASVSAKPFQIAGAAAKAGTFLGAADALGRSEKEDLAGQALDTAHGAGAGMVGGAAGGRFIGAPAARNAERLEQLGGSLATRALGGTGSDIRKMVQESGGDLERPAEVGLELLRRKLIPWLGKPKDILPGLEQEIPSALAEKRAAVQALDESGTPVDLAKIFRTLDADAAAPKLGSDLEATRGLGGKIRETLGNTLEGMEDVPGLATEREVPFSRADQLLRDVQSRAYSRAGGGDEVFQEIAPGFRQAMRSEAAARPEYAAANDSLAKLIAAKKTLDARLPMLEGNRAAGLLDTMAGGAALAGGLSQGQGLKSVLMGAGATAASKIIRERGPSLAANTFYSLSQALAREPNALGPYAQVLLKAAERGPEALYTTHRILMTNNPDYFQAWERQAQAEAVPVEEELPNGE